MITVSTKAKLLTSTIFIHTSFEERLQDLVRETDE